MSSANLMSRSSPLLTYLQPNCAVFFKVDEEWGGLSNMAGGYPLAVATVEIRTSEALYQACRYPHRPELQSLIIEQKSPMAAKMKSKPHRMTDSRTDWNAVEVDVMRWCLQVKLKQNWSTFANLLRATGERPIVEKSRKDDFWGAKEVKDLPGQLVGRNVLGRLLMELRDEINAKTRTGFTAVAPLPISDFLLTGKPIPSL